VFASFQLSNVITDKSDFKYFTNFPDERSIHYPQNLTSFINRNNINYVIDISPVHQLLFEHKYHEVITLLLPHLRLEKVKEITGVFDDSERDYFINQTWRIPDTLRLYKVAGLK
jgi:hypothetical protein